MVALAKVFPQSLREYKNKVEGENKLSLPTRETEFGRVWRF
jgi:hypothetical protein